MKHAPHTPGGWTLNGYQLVSLHTDEDGDHETLIADVFDDHDWAPANARLLRAAPELLALLRTLHKLLAHTDLAFHEANVAAAALLARFGLE